MTKICTLCLRTVLIAALTFVATTSAVAENIDFTDFIVNPSFESGFSGWFQSGMQVQTNTTFPLKDGNTYVERWVPADNGAGECEVSQTIVGLLPGDYTLTASAQNIREGKYNIQNGVWVFAGDNRTDVGYMADYSVNFTIGAEGEIKIGYLASGATGNYLAVDNFRLLYTRYDSASMPKFIDNVCREARDLLRQKIDVTTAEALTSVMNELHRASDVADISGIIEALRALRKTVAEANNSAEAYSSLKSAIEKLTVAFKDIEEENGAESVGKLLDDAGNEYDKGELSAEEATALALKLSNAILLFHISQSDAPSPEVSTVAYIARGSTFALGRSNIKLPIGATILESGFCWNTHPNPTLADYRSSKTLNHNGIIYYIKGLKPSTVYYLRAYAITKDYGVGYGDVVKVITIPTGEITYSYDPNGATSDVNARILAAVDEAVEYWNNSTSFTGFHVSVSYNKDVNTADCSYGGWVRVGPRENYQRTGTLMHEMNHGVGVGQHFVWFGPDSPYRESGNTGLWLGSRATELVRFLENDPQAMLHGDTQHMWPYGINGAHEDDGTEILYLANGLVTQALCEDALPPVAGAFHSPSYFFKSEAGEKYYLKVENIQRGCNTHYLTEGNGNIVEWNTMSGAEARVDDHAAWYIEFDPLTCYYTIRNVATGNYLVWSPDTSGAVFTSSNPSAGEINFFQFTGSIDHTTTAGHKDYTYWLTAAQKSSTPDALAVGPLLKPVFTGYDIHDRNGNQRWHILTLEEMAAFDEAAEVDCIIADDNNVNATEEYFDLQGRRVYNPTQGIYILRRGTSVSKVVVK